MGNAGDILPPTGRESQAALGDGVGWLCEGGKRVDELVGGLFGEFLGVVGVIGAWMKSASLVREANDERDGGVPINSWQLGDMDT